MRSVGYGGIRFELAGELERVGDLADFATDPPVGPFLASCALRWTEDRSAPPPRSREIRFELDRAGGRIVSDAFRASIARTGVRAYSVEARLAIDEPSAALTGIAAALVHDLGGVVLHASALVACDRLRLFIGPSGAGKTRVAHRVEPALGFARDRVAVFAIEGSMHGAPLGGGDPIARRFADPAPRPIASIDRVCAARDFSLERLSLAQAVTTLRESTQVGIDDESSLLDRLERIARAVAVRKLAFVDGRTIDARSLED